MQTLRFTNGRIAHDTLLVARGLRVPPKRILECARLYRAKLSAVEQEDIYSIGGTLGRPVGSYPSEHPYSTNSRIRAAIEAKNYLQALTLSVDSKDPKAFLAATVGLRQPLIFDSRDLNAMTESNLQCHLGYVQFRDDPVREVVAFGMVGESTKSFEDCGAYPIHAIELQLITRTMPQGQMDVIPVGYLPYGHHVVVNERELTNIRFKLLWGASMAIKIRFMTVDWPTLSS